MNLAAQPILADDDDLSPLAADYSRLSWSDAFVALNQRLTRFYPFSASKRVDWNERRELFLGRILRAESLGDAVAYYAALREYAYSIADGHVALTGASEAMASLEERAIGASFGLRLVDLVDRRVVVSEVIADGPAASAGIEVGAQILTWNDAAIDAAVEAVATLWADVPPPTREGRRLEQLALLTRAPLGTAIRITFQNPGAAVRSATLSATDDDTVMQDISPFPSAEELLVPVDYWILPSGIGYLRIVGFEADTKKDEQAFIATLREAVTLFSQDRVPGVIIDLRRNVGGLNRLTVYAAGFFYKRRAHYETVTTYDAQAQRFEVNEDDPESRLYITPRRPRYRGRLAILVDYGCMSGAEGLALALQRLPGAKVIGMHGSHGSYGISSADVAMPEGLKFEYPYGRSLNARGQLRIDSDYKGEGGVIPDIRVPLDDASFRAKYIEKRDIEIEAAVTYLVPRRRRATTKPSTR